MQYIGVPKILFYRFIKSVPSILFQISFNHMVDPYDKPKTYPGQLWWVWWRYLLVWFEENFEDFLENRQKSSKFRDQFGHKTFSKALNKNLRKRSSAIRKRYLCVKFESLDLLGGKVMIEPENHVLTLPLKIRRDKKSFAFFATKQRPKNRRSANWSQIPSLCNNQPDLLDNIYSSTKYLIMWSHWNLGS